jgi:hypothetical protein
LEKSITKDILKNELYSGQQPAVELLYTRYSGMLFSYILQFVPDREEAANLLVKIFYKLTPQLQEAFDSSLSIYCWLQVEARKIILEYTRNSGDRHPSPGDALSFAQGTGSVYYFSLLEDASPEHQWIFRELFIYGRQKEELVLQSGKELTTIGRLLRECLLIIRKKMG